MVKNIIFFSSDNWQGNIKKRPHHLCLEWSKSHRVIFVNCGEKPKIKLKGFFKNPAALFGKQVEKINDNLYVFENLFSVPWKVKMKSVFLDRVNARQSAFYLKRIMKKLGIKDYIVGISDISSAYCLDYLRDYKLLFYDCVDEWSEFSNASKKVVNVLEEKIIEKADLIFTTAQALLQKRKKYNKDVYLVPNAVDVEHFKEKTISQKNKLKIKKPLVGYVGVIYDWFDMNILEYCAEKKDDFNFVIIGPSSSKAIEEEMKELTKKYKNIFWLGEKSYQDVPEYIQQFDVCIVPFKINELIKNVDPIKVYEYLAMGKPVVSTYWKELEKFSSFIALGLNYEDFLKKIEDEYNKNSEEKIKERRKFAEENAWQKRAEKMMEIINKKLNNNV